MTTVAEHLQALVSIPTHQRAPDGTIGDERKLCEHLAPLLRARGADEVSVELGTRSDGTPGAYIFARWGTPTKVINAHVDTVPPNRGWTRDPWSPAIDGGKLYGLGSADTKGAIVSILDALDRAKPRDLAVLFSGDEEKGTQAMHAFLASPDRAGVTHAIVCEPTARTAGVRHRGVLAERARIRGAGGHSSRADATANPIAILARAAAALDDFGRELCLNVAALEGGVAFNVVPDAASLIWSIRPPPGFDRGAWDRAVADAIARIDPMIDHTVQMDHAPFACSDVAGAARMLPGVPQVSLDFWTEAALHEAAGIAAIVVGPGDIAQAHAPDESVALDDLEWAADLFATAIRQHG